MKMMRLGTKLTYGGILIVFIPLFVVGVFTFMQSSKSLENLAKDNSIQVAKSLSSLVQMGLTEELKNMQGLSVDPILVGALTGGSIETASEKLTAIMKKIGGDYETIMLIGSDGVIKTDGVGGSYKGINIGDRDYVIAAKEGRASIGTAIKSKKTGNPVSVACAPIYGPGGEVIGAIGAAVKIDFLIEKLASIKLGKTGYAFMLNKEGLTIAHPKKEHIFKTNLTNEEGMKGFAGKMIAQQAGSEEYVFRGVKKLAGYAPVELTGWSVGVTQNMDELMAPATTLRNFVLTIGLVFLVITILAVLYLARSISRPITRTVRQLNETADQVASASAQVSSASQQLAESSSEQASGLEETSSSLEEMSSMTRQNAENAQQANSLIVETGHVVDEANRSMNDLIESMKEITTASEETAKIIKTIDEIAFQTNLLALNAAVEAARAGEAGSGFAVVADEVRNLAMRAAEASKNTANLIEGTVMKIKQGSDIVSATNKAFIKVAEGSSKVNDLVAEITTASQEQAQGIGQISKAIAEMDKVIQRSAASAEESASASEEMTAQAGQMKVYVEELVTVIGGSQAGDNNLLSSPNEGKQQETVTKIVALPFLASRRHEKIKGRQRKTVTPAKAVSSRSEQLIPFEAEEFRSF